MIMANSRLVLIAAAAGALALGLPTVGDAQNRPGAGAGAVMWGGDSLAYTENGFVLTGRAEVTQGQNRLRANRLNMVTAGGDLTQVEATGDVYFVTPEQTMRGDRAVYDLSGDTVTVTGDVILTQGENVVTGGRLVYNVRTERAQMDGGSAGRVRGVFYPNSNAN